MSFKDILENIDIKEELDYRGIKGKITGKNLMICCPFHSEKSPSFGISITGERKGLYQCWSTHCGETGTFFHLISHLDDIPFEQALKKYKINFDSKKIAKFKTRFLEFFTSNLNKKDTIKIINKKVLDRFEKPDGPYLSYLIEKRKLNKDIINQFNLLACKKGKWKERIIIPVYSEKENLVSLVARSIDPKINKYAKVRKLKDSDINKVLFGLNYILNLKKFKGTKTLYLVEGEFDCIYLQQFGIPAVSIGKGVVSKGQLVKLCKYFSSCYLCLDGDVSDKKILEKKKELARYLKVKIKRLPEGLDPNELSSDEVKKIFKECFNG